MCCIWCITYIVLSCIIHRRYLIISRTNNAKPSKINGQWPEIGLGLDIRWVTMAGYFELMQKFFQTNNKTKEYQVHSSKVHSVAWNCDGRRLASGSFDKTVVTFVFDRTDRLVSSTDVLPKCKCQLSWLKWCWTLVWYMLNIYCYLTSTLSEHRQSGLFSEGLWCMYPVSYTHLTLPTKRIV